MRLNELVAGVSRAGSGDQLRKEIERCERTGDEGASDGQEWVDEDEEWTS